MGDEVMGGLTHSLTQSDGGKRKVSACIVCVREAAGLLEGRRGRCYHKRAL